MTSKNIEEATDEAATMTDDIAALNEKVAALDRDVAVATAQRKDDHAEYLETVSLTEAAIQLMGKAKNRLNKFYQPALYKEAAKKELSDEDAIVSRLSFVQVSRHTKVAQPVAPALFQTGSVAPNKKSGGVMALMDMLVGELTASLADAEHGEKTGEAGYTTLMSDAQATRASDSKALVNKNAAKANLEGKLVDLKESR